MSLLCCTDALQTRSAGGSIVSVRDAIPTGLSNDWLERRAENIEFWHEWNISPLDVSRVNSYWQAVSAHVRSSRDKSVLWPLNAGVRLFIAFLYPLWLVVSFLINRLRIGHTRLTNSYLLKEENQPECQICHSPLTVKHILIDCICSGAARQRYLGVDTLKELFENVESRNIVAFIQDTNFYHCI